jgi:hypothetical protein
MIDRQYSSYCFLASELSIGTEKYFYCPHLVVLGRYCACEILIANPIDWLYADCVEYFIFFPIDSSEARKQYDEYCLSIMQTITYAHDRNMAGKIPRNTACTIATQHHKVWTIEIFFCGLNAY